jgi:hypothetical protein
MVQFPCRFRKEFKDRKLVHYSVMRIRDPGYGIRGRFDPGIRDGYTVRVHPDHISQSLETIFLRYYT